MTYKSNFAPNPVSRAIRSAFTLFACAILIILNLLCYRQTLGGYFLADDYVHVAYLADVFNGHPLKLLENFTGNWMHAWGTQFYRPFISLTLAFDYWLGNGGAFAFHLTNTIYHCIASILLFLIARRLLSDFDGKQRYFTALAASALFAVCPLHTEVVSWIIGRVDGVCLTFFLGAYYFYLRHRQERNLGDLVLSVVLFAISLISKEMAITLPPLVVLTSFTLGRGALTKRLGKALTESIPFWCALAIYFCVRTLALGMFFGGYGGSVGEGLSSSFIERFKSAAKIIFPFNCEVISPYDRLTKQLTQLYRISAAFVAIRLLLMRSYSSQFKMALFCVAWFVLALVPTYQVFNITDSLMCSRFAYFATAPFCLLIAIVLSPLWTISKSTMKWVNPIWLSRISAILLVCYVVLFTNITIKNNSSWAHAGAQVREFRKAVANACADLAPTDKLVLLNVPQRMEGAHMIYNGAMLEVLLSEPLSRPPIAKRVISFEPPTYGDAEFINVSRLRKLQEEHPQYKFCYWDMASKKLLNLHFEKEPVELNFPLTQLNASTIKSPLVIVSPPLNLNTLSCDFVVCTLTLPTRPASAPMELLTLFWSSTNFPSFSPAHSISLPAKTDGKEHSYYFAVSERKSWLAGERINRLKLQLPGPASNEKANQLSLSNIRIMSGEKLMPLLSPAPEQLAEGLDGIGRLASDHFKIVCDASKISRCTSILVEMSKPNSWFEHYTGSYRDKEFSKERLKKFSGEGSLATLEFKRSDFPQPAYYELRAFALDKEGKVIGFCSDPVELQIN